jgi:hypothetical protein
MDIEEANMASNWLEDACDLDVETEKVAGLNKDPEPEGILEELKLAPDIYAF